MGHSIKTKSFIRAFTVLFFFSLVTSAQADELGTSAPSSPTNSAIQAQTLESSLKEITGTRDADLAQRCSDCNYDAETNVTTCDPDATPHHKMRCQNILWSAQTAKSKKYQGCREFLVGENGNLGKMGHIVMDEIIKDIHANGTSSPFLQNNDNFLSENDDNGVARELCPAFNSFDDVTRAQFYLYLMENIAYREVSCSPKDVENRSAPTSTAVCAFQLELSSRARKGRPEACLVSSAEIKKPENCGRCAVQMMAWSLRRPTTEQPDKGYYLPNKPFGSMDAHKVVTNHSYWQSLNPDSPAFLKKWYRAHPATKTHPAPLPPHAGLMNDIKYFPPCRASLTTDVRH